jgi:uncharacterized Tic20 family protein
MSDTPPNSDLSASSTPPTKDERNLALLSHLLGIFTGFLGPLIIWLIKKDSSAYVSDQSKEALNFQITVAIAYLVSGLLTFVLIGCVLMPIVLLGALVLAIMATIAASKGEPYRYPLTLRLIS